MDAKNGKDLALIMKTTLVLNFTTDETGKTAVLRMGTPSASVNSTEALMPRLTPRVKGGLNSPEI